MNLSLLFRESTNSCASGWEDQRSTTRALSPQQAVSVPTAPRPQDPAGPSLFPKGIAAWSKTTPVRKRWDQPLCKEGLGPRLAWTLWPFSPPGQLVHQGWVCLHEPCVLLPPQRCMPLMGTTSRIQAQWRGASWGVREPRHQMTMAGKSLLTNHKVQRQRRVPFSWVAY